MVNFKKRVAGNYWNKSTINAEIDYAVQIGADCYDTVIEYPSEVSAIRNGGADPIAQGIAYAHSRGIKFLLRIPEYRYGGPTYSWNLFTTTPSYQTTFLTDFEWLLYHYPTIDGIEIEESEGYLLKDAAGNYILDPNTPQYVAWRTFKNGFLLKEKAIVEKYHSITDGSFMWGVNMGNSWWSTQALLGYDLPNIISNKLVNSITTQVTQETLQQYKDRLSEAKTAMTGSGITLQSYVAVYSKAWNNTCITTPTPTCYNQFLFDYVKYVIDQGAIPCIFTLMRLTIASPNWPNDTTPGATAGDKIKSIWGAAAQPCISGLRIDIKFL